MSICAEIINGVLVESSDSLADCAGYVVISATEYGLFSSLTTATPSELLYLYSWGMGAILLPWSIAYGIAVAKRTVAKI